MKGKLIKKHDHWTLWNQVGRCIANTINADGFPFKLSKKNCQAIERGYDLDELAKIHHRLEYCDGYNPEIAPYVENDYKMGFQKCLEILGDKKFTEDNIMKYMDFISAFNDWTIKDEEMVSRYSFPCAKLNPVNAREQFIQSLQQTEWDVEIVEDTSVMWQFPEPDIDKNGCLILKRI